MANIGIFGGSFNPPHRGHLLAAAEFQRRLGLDRVILMPAALPPWAVTISVIWRPAWQRISP